jgi:hypothetical protein
MAHILPNNPIGAIAPETLKLFRLLKRLPDTYAIWQRLNPGAEVGPDFWVRRNDGRAALIAVSTATVMDVRGALQERLFEQTTRPGVAEQAALVGFAERVALPDPVFFATVPGLVLFPNVARGELDLVQPAMLPHGIVWGAKEDLAPDRFTAWLEEQLGAPLTSQQSDTIRRAFVPEIVVPAQLTVRAPVDRGTDARLTDYVLSYNQEWVLKYDLDLSDEAAAATDDLHLQLVNGVAGSGKSLILVYRARLLRRFFPHKRVLVLTHNKPLILDLQRRYLQLSGGDRGVEWRTFHGWCQKYWPEGEPRVTLVRIGERKSIVARVWQRHLGDTAISPELLQDEIDWVKDHLITSEQGYLEADRSGRGFGLNETMRARMFAAIRAYQAELHSRGLADYSDVPRRLWRALVEGDVQFPVYDFVLIDEAQFFAPIWFELIKRMLNPKSGHLFMAADPTQGFLKRRQSWTASGLHVRGRTHHLARCYRTTGAILDFATQFYQLRLPEDDEAIIAANVQQMPHGPPPQVIPLTSEQDELARVVNEIRALSQAGMPLEHIMVIHADWQGAGRALERLRMEFGMARVVHARDRPTDQHIRVCALDAATGLESPIVFLIGMHRLYEAEQSLRMSEEERSERIRDNTRRLYMAMTRAGQRLLMTHVGPLPEVLDRTVAHCHAREGAFA